LCSAIKSEDTEALFLIDKVSASIECTLPVEMPTDSAISPTANRRDPLQVNELFRHLLHSPCY